MTPLERAARALALAQSGSDDFDGLDDDFQDVLVETARAVLGAIREPSDDMLCAAQTAEGAARVWQAMLDAALAERATTRT